MIEAKKLSDKYLIEVLIKTPLHAIALYQELEGKRLSRRQLKYGIDVEYVMVEEDSGELLFIIEISGDIAGINNVKNVDKIIHLLKSSIQTS